MSKNPSVRLPQTVYDRAEAIQDEYDFASKGEAIRHMCREGGFDV